MSSANIELALLSKVIESQNFHAVEKAQVGEEFFATPEAREVFRYLKLTFHAPQTVGQVPSVDMVRYRFPNFYFTQGVRDDVSVLCAQLRYEKIRMESSRVAAQLAQLAEQDPQAAVALLRSESAAISALSEVGQDLAMSSAFQMLWERYSVVAQTSGMLGIPYPWAQLNEETQGMQEGQFLVIYGRPKSMKSWIAIYMAVHAYLHSRRRVMFYTREMSVKLVAQRVAAAMAGVDYKSFINSTLQPHLRDRAFAIFQQLREDEQAWGATGNRTPCFQIVSDRGAGGSMGGGGVGWLQSKIREVQPDVVFVDGMYLMKDDRSQQRSVDWKQIAHISQDLKLTAQEFNIPLIGVTQANRNAQKSKGEDLTELAFSDSLGQDADAVFRSSLEGRTNEQTGEKEWEIIFTAPGLREGRFPGMVLHAHPAVNFGFKRMLTAEDLNRTQDGYGEGGGGGGRSRGNGAQAPGAPRPMFVPTQDVRIRNPR